MAVVIAFPSKKAPQPLRALDCPSYPLSRPQPMTLKNLCEAIIFGCFLVAVVLTIYAFGGP